MKNLYESILFYQEYKETLQYKNFIKYYYGRFFNIYLFTFSCNMKLNLDFLLETLWEYLSLIRVYTKKPGQPPDFDDGLILRKGVTIQHVCHAIHRTLAEQFKYGLVWVSNFNINSNYNIN